MTAFDRRGVICLLLLAASVLSAAQATCPPGIYQFKINADRSVSQTSPLGALSLGPGTYDVWVDGGIGANVALRFQLGNQPATATAGISVQCVPDPGRFNVPAGSLATQFNIDNLDAGRGCHTGALIAERGFCIDRAASAPVTHPDCAATVISDNWNTAACGTTRTATFSLPATTFVKSLTVWYNTERGGLELPFELNGPAGAISGSFQTEACDPYQSQWCAGVYTINANWAPGEYRIRTGLPAVCQNSGSAGNGFVRVTGCAATAPTARPQDPEKPDCKPGTNPFEEDVCVHPK